MPAPQLAPPPHLGRFFACHTPISPTPSPQELYFRHLYARCQPDLRQRCESWDNYCDLFGLLLHSNVNMQLPNCWLWDMVDEFVYQFQSFSQYRAKVGARGGEEGALLAQCDKVWAVGEVLNVLQALVDKSGIVAELEAEGGAARWGSHGGNTGMTHMSSHYLCQHK